jgi:hypothetical protein
LTSRRNAVSVMPAMGARANGGERSIVPIFNGIAYPMPAGAAGPVVPVASSSLISAS